MTLRVLVLGGYGNFGGYVCRALADDARIQLVVAGRSRDKAQAFAEGLGAANPAEAAVVDIGDPAQAMAECRPDLVIHTVGPFQGRTTASPPRRSRAGRTIATSPTRARSSRASARSMRRRARQGSR